MSMRRRGRFSVERIAQCGLLTAMMLVLGFIESLLPVAAGVPGIKLGLSNGVLLFALYMMDAPTAFVLMLLKVLLSGLLFGGVSAMMYAMAGGICSGLGTSPSSGIRWREWAIFGSGTGTADIRETV